MALYENIKKLVMTLSAQAGWSGANFAVTVILARYLEPAAFGVFGLFLALKTIFFIWALTFPLEVPYPSRINMRRSSILILNFSSLYILAEFNLPRIVDSLLERICGMEQQFLKGGKKSLPMGGSLLMVATKK